ncbi:MAG: TIGR01777 family protein [Cytophagia bacterium]|nr:TIGR01777 family protein [Cytophagia bacterium]
MQQNTLSKIPVPSSPSPPIVLIAGGSGLIGTALCKHLVTMGAQVRILSRSAKTKAAPTSNPSFYFWNPQTAEIDDNALTGVTHLVNLAGAGIADKAWTKARRLELLWSRTQSADCLAAALQKASEKAPTSVQRIVTASAIGFYTPGEVLATEESPGGSGFLAELTGEWEKHSAALGAWAPLTTLRIGLVLSPHGGLLAPLLPMTRLGLGACIGSGRQWMSWIHEKDMVRLIMHSLFDPEWPSGIFNAVAPLPRRHLGFMRSLAKALQRPLWIALPGWPLRLLMGPRSTLLLEGVLASSQKVQNQGFAFEYPELDQALHNLIKNPAPKT